MPSSSRATPTSLCGGVAKRTLPTGKFFSLTIVSTLLTCRSFYTTSY